MPDSSGIYLYIHTPVLAVALQGLKDLSAFLDLSAICQASSLVKIGYDVFGPRIITMVSISWLIQTESGACQKTSQNPS